MDETMVQDETMDDVVETDADVIEEDDAPSINPLMVGASIAAGLGIAVFALRKQIGNIIENAEEKWVISWCDKHGKTYITIEDSENTEEAKEN